MNVKSFSMQRLGVVMEPRLDDPGETGGVLNPGGVRGPDGAYYLFPRLVEAPNYSRVGVARVIFEDGEPVGAERLGLALEPEAAFERNPHTAGCEDARVTYIKAIERYVIAYSSYGPFSSRIALAISEDCLDWQRLGPALFSYEDRWLADFNLFTNKDAFFFPEPVPDPDGEPAIALVHRPDFDVGGAESFVTLPAGIEEERAGMWISYARLSEVERDIRGLANLRKHRPLAFSEQDWEHLKVGGGTPPVRTPHGWLMVYHGVSGTLDRGLDHQPQVRYCAGVMILADDDPLRILYRSEEPVLKPEEKTERVGIVDNVVFPTALDARESGRIDVYYGMADARIGVARLQMPTRLAL
ncbi:MAG: glycosidase [Rubrobacteraceae bacterium]|nr:glycosidase [Rubrobacteraceae bacterium]